MSKSPRFDLEPSSSQKDPEPAPALSVEQHQAMIMSCSIIIELQITLSVFNNLRFENQTLLEVVEHAGWVPFLQRIGPVSMDIVRDFYAVIILFPNISDPSWEVTVRNIRVLFSPDELAKFMVYERPMDAFPNLPLSEEVQPPKVEVFRMMLGLDTVISEEGNMQQGLDAPVLGDHELDPILLHRPEEAHD